VDFRSRGSVEVVGLQMVVEVVGLQMIVEAVGLQMVVEVVGGGGSQWVDVKKEAGEY
jgi:hypothetical protein